jgi:hypothetical protein
MLAPLPERQTPAAVAVAAIVERRVVQRSVKPVDLVSLLFDTH